jgi:hypothetical protein
MSELQGDSAPQWHTALPYAAPINPAAINSR